MNTGDTVVYFRRGAPGTMEMGSWIDCEITGIDGNTIHLQPLDSSDEVSETIEAKLSSSSVLPKTW